MTNGPRWLPTALTVLLALLAGMAGSLPGQPAALVGIAGLVGWWLLVAGLAALLLRWIWGSRARTLDAVAETLDGFAQGRYRLPQDSETSGPPQRIPGRLRDHLQALGEALQAAREQTLRQEQDQRRCLERLATDLERSGAELQSLRERARDTERHTAAFLAGISHEIRTPLQGIRGFTEVLARSELAPEQRDYVNTIRDSCDGLLAIVEDLRAFSRLGTGEPELDRTALDIRDSVEEVLALLAPAAYAKGLELLHLVYDDVPGSLYGDPLRIRQILTNLVHNAIKFTPSGEVVLRVMLEEEEDPRTVLLRCTVSDTGIGLAAAERSALLEDVDTGPGGLPRSSAGGGPGLAICRRLVESMGGELGVESEPEKGSTFWFTLQLARPAESEGRPRRDRGLEGLRLLYLDSVDRARMAVRPLLEGWGATVLDTDDPARLAAEAEADPRRWNAAVVGLGHGEMDSAPAQSTLRRLEQLGIPVLVLASTVDRPALRSLYRCGASAALPRVVHRRTIYRELCRLLGPKPERLGNAPGDGPARVLVADDDPVSRKLLCTLATGLGARVMEAVDGEEALRLCGEHRFDTVFMDARMPRLDGAAALARLRNQGLEARLVAVTASAAPEEHERLLAAGADDCLTKPVAEAQILTSVPALGQRLRSGTPAAPRAPERLRLDLQRMLREEVPEHRRSLRKAYRDSDMDTLRQAVHRLHGAVSVCHLAELQAACRDLEHALAETRRAAVPALFQAVLSALDRFEAEAEGPAEPADQSSSTTTARA